MTSNRVFTPQMQLDRGNQLKNGDLIVGFIVLKADLDLVGKNLVGENLVGENLVGENLVGENLVGENLVMKKI